MPAVGHDPVNVRSQLAEAFSKIHNNKTASVCELMADYVDRCSFFPLPMPRIFRPSLCVEDVVELAPSRLCELNLDSLLLDVDGTLKRYKETQVSEHVGKWLGSLQDAGIGLCLVSNGRGPRIERFASSLGLSFIAKACKPFPWGLKRAIREHGFDRMRTAMVGDQLLADIVAGNLAGLTTVLVRPIHPEDEQWFTRIKRPPERWLLRLMGLGN